MSGTTPLDLLKARYSAARQSHVLTFYDTLPVPEQASLMAELEALDVERVNRIFAKAIEAESGVTPKSSPRLKINTLVDVDTLVRVRRERSESLGSQKATSPTSPSFPADPKNAPLTMGAGGGGGGGATLASIGASIASGVQSVVSSVTGSTSAAPTTTSTTSNSLNSSSTTVESAAASLASSTQAAVAAVTDRFNGLLTSPASATTTAPLDDDIEPLPSSCSSSVLDSPAQTAAWRATGLRAIAASQVGVLLMAGGQGTRLGSSAPKGCFDIGLPSGKTLFQYQAERIRRLQQVAREEVGGENEPVITWFVMTSGPTRKETEAFFREKAFFGLKEENVIFFEQGVLPCLTEDGKILLSSPSSLALSPDGNGGVYSALRRPLSSSDSRTVLSIMAERSIAFIHAYGVDNCLVRVADPCFLGYCITQEAECGAKVVPKSDPTESVGVVARKGGAFGVVEYTELPKAKAELRDPTTGLLAFRAANIANHFYTSTFLSQIDSFEPLMAFHIARKKIPTVDLSSGQPFKPDTPNGMKLEMFVFDVFPFTETLAVLEVERTEEFSPLKNGAGSSSDNQVTSRRDLLAQQRRWIDCVGGKIEAGEGEEVEVSPLVSYAGEGLERLKGVVFRKGGVLESLDEDALKQFQ